MKSKYYEVVLFVGHRCLVSWRFNSISVAVRYLAEVDFDICDAEVFRSDGKKLNVDALMEAWFNA